uniref:Uncharacterized protein n=1 Tax=Arundo donax TaxID=35708 RepID=A0A0A9FRJ6_ARUDO
MGNYFRPLLWEHVLLFALLKESLLHFTFSFSPCCHTSNQFPVILMREVLSVFKSSLSLDVKRDNF